MIYKTFEEWKAGQWLEDGEPRTKAYTADELLLIEMGWQYGFDAGIDQSWYKWSLKEGYVKDLTNEEIKQIYTTWLITGNDPVVFARAILKKASEK